MTRNSRHPEGVGPGFKACQPPFPKELVFNPPPPPSRIQRWDAMGQPGEITDWAGGGSNPSAKGRLQDRGTDLLSNPALPPPSLPGLALSEHRGCGEMLGLERGSNPVCGTLGNSLNLSGPPFALSNVG